MQPSESANEFAGPLPEVQKHYSDKVLKNMVIDVILMIGTDRLFVSGNCVIYFYEFHSTNLKLALTKFLNNYARKLFLPCTPIFYIPYQ